MENRLASKSKVQSDDFIDLARMMIHS